MCGRGLELAEHKTEAIVFTRRYKNNQMKVKCGNTIVSSGKSIKYLELTLELHYKEHAIQITTKTVDTCRQLGYILPNLDGASYKRRKQLSSVVTSRLLYGAPCWEKNMTTKAWKKLETVHRRMKIKTACGYRTVSHDAAGAVSSTAPLRLLAKHRAEIYAGGDRKASEERLYSKWQEGWEQAYTGRWKFKLISKIQPWVKRVHGEVNYHLTQFITGHGSFGEYPCRFRHRATNECQLCGVSPDTPEHASFRMRCVVYGM